MGDKREPEFVGEVAQVSAFASEELFFTLGEDGFIVVDSIGDHVPDDARELMSHGRDRLGCAEPSA